MSPLLAEVTLIFIEGAHLEESAACSSAFHFPPPARAQRSRFAERSWGSGRSFRASRPSATLSSGAAAPHARLARLPRRRRALANNCAPTGLSDVKLEQFPADGRVFYGTQRSRPPWDAEFAELWELGEEAGGKLVPRARLASWEAMPLTLAQDSESADVTAELLDVGGGTSEADYAGKDVRGKIVLTSAQPGEAARLAVERFGAAGLVSYAQKQRKAWWGRGREPHTLGHLDTFAPTKKLRLHGLAQDGACAPIETRARRAHRLRAEVLAANTRAPTTF